MAVKYYSERTKKFYDTAAECERAEFEAKEAENREKIRKEREIAYQKELREKKEAEEKVKAAERKADAEKVEAARKAMVEAQNKYREEIENFCKKWKSYHFSTSDVKEIPTLFNSVFSDFWNLFS